MAWYHDAVGHPDIDSHALSPNQILGRATGVSTTAETGGPPPSISHPDTKIRTPRSIPRSGHQARYQDQDIKIRTRTTPPKLQATKQKRTKQKKSMGAPRACNSGSKNHAPPKNHQTININKQAANCRQQWLKTKLLIAHVNRWREATTGKRSGEGCTCPFRFLIARSF